MSYQIKAGKNARPFFLQTAGSGYIASGAIENIYPESERNVNGNWVPGDKKTCVRRMGSSDGGGFTMTINAPCAEVRRAFEERGYEFVDFPLAPPAKVKTSLTPL